MEFKLKKYEGNPILKPIGDSWESLCVLNPAVVYDSENDEFIMLYRAAGNDEKHYIYLGLAKSKDGFNFIRQSDKPAFEPDYNGADGGCVEDPRLVKIGDWYYLTYASRPYAPGRYWLDEPKPWFNPPKEGPVFLNWNNSLTYLAITQDFKTFKKLGRITDSRDDDRDVFVFPEKVNGKWVRFSRPMFKVGEEWGCKNPSIWISFSDDLMEWPKPTLFATGIEPWESAKLGGSTPPIKTKDGWLFLYHGVSEIDKCYRVGAMLLDLEDPTKILHRTKTPILEPVIQSNDGAIYSGCVFPTGNCVKDGVLYVYYGVNDKEIAVATANLDELIEYLKKEC